MHDIYLSGTSIVVLVLVISYLASMLFSGIEVAFLISFPAIFPESDSLSVTKQKQIESVLEHPEKALASVWFLKVFFLLASSAVFIYWNLAEVYFAILLAIFIAFFVISYWVVGSVCRRYPLFFLKVFFALTGVIQFFSGWISFRLFVIHNAIVGKVLNEKSPYLKIRYAQHQEPMQEGTVSDEDILKGIVKFGQIEVSEILRPRVDVVSIEISNTLVKVLETAVKSGYSRIPVYSGTFDNVKGILYVKDLLPYLSAKDTFRWQTLVRHPYFVPETKKVKDLLTEFKTGKIHMAVVVDEYGGTLGIVTLEDILEEIVGEITDESDEEEKFYTKINDNTYIFDGKTLLNDFHKVLQTDNNIFDQVRGDADTLAGLILELKGAIPEKNEQIVYKQFKFRIIGVDARRIKQIKVSITNE
jgi:gliding motility-associated protein GldE